jgi:CDP-6-deoxy-D-xylo-4-hexulose-3-dehydrase
MIKLVSDTIDKNDIKNLVDWLSQDEIPRLTKGDITIEFEKKWSDKIGVEHTTYVNSGSSAILLALAALKESGKLKNNKIIVPALSWLTDVSSPMQLGMDVILCDCNLDDLSIDINHLKQLIKEQDPSSLILVSVLGLVPNMSEIVSICEDNNIVLIEDVCESMGSKFEDRYLGTFGIVSLFSLYYGHHLSTIEGGLICTNDTELNDIIVSMRSHGWDRDWSKERQKEYREKYKIDDFNSLYTFYYPGFNFRSTDLQAFIGLTQVDKLDNFSTNRERNFKLYNSNITINELNIKYNDKNFISNFAYPIVSKNRENIVKRLIENNIEVRPLIAGSMARKPFWKGRVDNLPNCDIINNNGFYIPNHQDLKNDDIIKICNIVNEDN